MAVTERTVSTPSARIRLSESDGKGLPVVLLHGSGSSRGVFRKQFADPLAAMHRVVALDLPGHGESSDAHDPVATYTVPGLAAVVAEVLAELQIERAIVFGWSLGGHIAIELLAGERLVAGAMLSGTPPVSRGPLGSLRGFHARWDMLLASKAVYTERDARRFERLCFGDSGEPDFLEAIHRADGRLRANVFRATMRGEGVDQRRTVENAQVPVAMINGEAEPMVRLGYIESLSYASLWDGHCHVIEGAGHSPFWQCPDLFNPLLRRFARDVFIAESERSRSGRRSTPAAA